VRRLVVLCSAARTTPHTWVFLEGLKAVLQTEGATEAAAKRTLSRVWAAWGLSQTWYRQRRYEQEGYATVAEYVRECWTDEFDDWDVRDLVARLETCQARDRGGAPAGAGSDYEAAMARITAPSVIMPGATDLYFPPEDAADEVELLPHGRL